MQARLLCALFWAGLLLTFAADSSMAEVVYRETFGTTVGQTPLSDVGWVAYAGNTTMNAALALPGTTGNPPQAVLSGGPGAGSVNPTPPPTYLFLGDVNAGDVSPNPSADHSAGYASLLSVNGAADFLTFTSEYTINRSNYRIDSFSFCATSTTTGDLVHAAVQIDGNWYASTSAVTPPRQSNGGGSTFQVEAINFALMFDAAAGNWRTVNFSVGSPLTLGNMLANALPVGDVTAFGLYFELADDPASTTERSAPRFDTFTVSATHTGDANGDGKVTDADYTIWADNYRANFGQQLATWEKGDFNGDKEITDADYTLWADNYGFGVTGNAVPEPGTISLLALGLAAMFRRKSR